MPRQVGDGGWLVRRLLLGDINRGLSYVGTELNLFTDGNLDVDAGDSVALDAVNFMAFTSGDDMTFTSAGVLYFTDGTGGPYSLADLLGGGAEIPVWVVTGSNPNGTLATSGIQYTPLAPSGAADTIQLQARIDTPGTYSLRLNYVMSVANANAVELTSTFLAVDEGEDPDAALAGGVDDTFTPGNDTNMHQHEVFQYVVTAGEELTVLLTRTAPAVAEHAGDFRLIDATLVPV